MWFCSIEVLTYFAIQYIVTEITFPLKFQELSFGRILFQNDVYFLELCILIMVAFFNLIFYTHFAIFPGVKLSAMNYSLPDVDHMFRSTSLFFFFFLDNFKIHTDRFFFFLNYFNFNVSCLMKTIYVHKKYLKYFICTKLRDGKKLLEYICSAKSSSQNQKFKFHNEFPVRCWNSLKESLHPVIRDGVLTLLAIRIGWIFSWIVTDSPAFFIDVCKWQIQSSKLNSLRLLALFKLRPPDSWNNFI